MRLLQQTSVAKRIYGVLLSSAVFAILVAAAVQVFMHAVRVEAGPSQLGVQKITLNPGGGRLSDGTDGIRFTINADPASDNYEYTNAGQDALLYRGTYQYCCSAGGPMLNIGGELYGQAGPGMDAQNWSSMQVIATSGVTTVGNRTENTGSSSAIVRYTVVRGELTYTVDRTVTYIYPNDYVTDDYDFVIPNGNEDTVKFYIGGDTAPGSSDQGYGIMLTEPVRSVISLNTSSQIMFGFREVSGSRPFDGATSQSFYTPYSVVQSGGDIGFVGSAFNHDAGLMMQWNLGSTPGAYEGRFQQFATKQGTNLNAAFAQSRVETGQQATLNISVVNSELHAVDSLGYTLTLPNGLLIDDSVTTDCSGSLTAVEGTGVITGSNIAIDGASNCVVTVPVASNTPGSYVINAASVSGLQGVLTNNVGSSTLNVGVYAITFVTQGGTSVSDIVAEEGDLIELPATTRPGNMFVEWNTAVNGSGTGYEVGEEFILPSEDLTLYAIWDPIPYDLTFNSQGGSAVAGETDIFYNDEIELAEPTRAGYRFVEWNTAANGSGTGYDAGDSYYMPAADTTLYAIWDRMYVITFDSLGGDAVEPYEDVAGGEAYLPDWPEREGFRLVGWNTAANGSGISYEPDEEYTFPANDVTLYAMWSPVYSFTLNVSGELEVDERVAGEEIGLPGYIPREGYEFIGWNTAASGSGATYTSETGFTMPAQNTTLYAIWEDNDGLSIADENAASPNGDANSDGLPDSQQSNVTSFVSGLTGKPTSLEVVLNDTEGDPSTCQIQSAMAVSQPSLGDDGLYSYPAGLLDFTVACGEPGFSATIKQYFYDLPGDSFVLRKFINGAFMTVEGASFEKLTLNGSSVWVATYTAVDGGSLDADGEANGVLVDPAGPAILTQSNPGVPNTGLGRAYDMASMLVLSAGIMVFFAGLVVLYRVASSKN